MRGSLSIPLIVLVACGGAGAGDDAGDDDGAPTDVPDPTIDQPMICDVPCPPPPVLECPQPSGDISQPIEVVPLRIDTATGAIVEIADGDHLDLRRPDQGGRVVYAGVRARNIADGCNVYVNGALRDPVSNRVIALESRPTYMAVDATGWAVPVMPFTQTLANVPACPQAAVEIDVDGHTWQLEIRLTEGARSTTVIRSVALDCVSDSFGGCECDCDHDPADGCYEFVDAGTD